MDKSLNLIKALKEGKLLVRTWGINKEYFYAYLYLGEIKFESRGFMSTQGDYRDRLSQIITNPELWEIDEFEMSQGYPYPWSVLQK